MSLLSVRGLTVSFGAVDAVAASPSTSNGAASRASSGRAGRRTVAASNR